MHFFFKILSNSYKYGGRAWWTRDLDVEFNIVVAYDVEVPRQDHTKVPS